MIKFEHSIFALPFAYLGLFLAEGGWPRASLLGWVTLAMVSFRTMAMAANRLVDVPVDRLNPRTQNRALPKGLLRPLFVWAVTFLSLALFEFSTWQLNPLCFQLSMIPVLLAWIYPFAKRFTWLSHGILGIILGIAPYGAWLASRQEFSWVPGLLTIGVTAWVAGFDIIYSMQDMDFDRKHRLFSFPAQFGSQAGVVLTRVLHTVAVASWWVAGVLSGRGFIYMLGMLAVTGFLIRENWLIRSCGLTKVGEVFFTMNAVVSIALFLAAAADLSLKGFGL